jgi:hypothetical protein
MQNDRESNADDQSVTIWYFAIQEAIVAVQNLP